METSSTHASEQAWNLAREDLIRRVSEIIGTQGVLLSGLPRRYRADVTARMVVDEILLEEKQHPTAAEEVSR